MKAVLKASVAWSCLVCASTAAQAQSQAPAPAPVLPRAQTDVRADGQVQATGADQAAEATPDTAAGNSRQLGDIVVTAQRRSENLQRAAIAVSVIGGDQLIAAGVSDPKALTKLVPSLQVSGASGPYSNFYIRGVGNFNATPLSEAAVAFNYDGVYVGRPSSTTGFFYDLERVEVLKGPQGTLYGRNATGGAINVIPRKPGDEFGGSFSAEYGNYDAVRLDGAINVPLNESAALRVAGILVRHDGYMKDGTDDQKDYGGRAQLRIDATSNLQINVGLDYFRQKGKGLGGTPIDTGVDNRFGVTSDEGRAFYQTVQHTLGGRTFDPLPDLQFQDNEFWGASATATWKGDIGSFTFIPAYREAKLDSINMGAVGYYVLQKEKSHQTSAELRYASPETNPLRLLVGGFYYDESTDSPRFLVNHQYDKYDQTIQSGTESVAAFGRVTYDLTETFRLNGGVRYTNEKKRFDGTLLDVQRVCLAGPFGCPNAVAFPYTDDRLNVTVLPTGAVVPEVRPDGTIQVGNSITSRERAKFERVTWRAGADWDITPRNLLYASYETGFKSGGFFASNDGGTFAPETIKAWTLGSKNRFLDNRLQINAEAFFWRYTDQQVSHIALDSKGAAVFITENVGRATFKGLEFEGRVLATSTTELQADVQYLDAKYNNFIYTVPNLGAPPSTGCDIGALNTVTNNFSVDCSGRRPPQAPKWTLNLGIQQTIPLPSDARIVIDLRTHYQSRTLTSLDFVERQYQGAYWQSDAQLNYRAADNKWFIGAYINNIEDTTVIGSSFQLPFSLTNNIIATLRPPRTYGVRAGFSF